MFTFIWQIPECLINLLRFQVNTKIFNVYLADWETNCSMPYLVLYETQTRTHLEGGGV